MNHFHDEYGFDVIPNMLREYADGKSTEEVFQTVLDRSREDVDEEMQVFLEEYYGQYSLRPQPQPQKVRIYQQRLAEDSEDTEARLQLARIALAGGNESRARELAGGVLDADPENWEAQAILGDLNFRSRQWAAAQRNYEKALENGANDFTTHFNLAQVLERREQVEGAIQQYENARAAFPRYTSGQDNPYLRLFELYREHGEPRKALDRLVKFSEIDHKQFDPHMELARVYQGVKQWEKAGEVLGRLVYIHYRDLKMHHRFATVNQELGRLQEAHREWRVLAALLEETREGEKSKRLRARYLLRAANLSKELGHTERAIEEAERAASLSDAYRPRAEELIDSLRGEGE